MIWVLTDLILMGLSLFTVNYSWSYTLTGLFAYEVPLPQVAQPVASSCITYFPKLHNSLFQVVQPIKLLIMSISENSQQSLTNLFVFEILEIKLIKVTLFLHGHLTVHI